MYTPPQIETEVLIIASPALPKPSLSSDVDAEGKKYIVPPRYTLQIEYTRRSNGGKSLLRRAKETVLIGHLGEFFPRRRDVTLVATSAQTLADTAFSLTVQANGSPRRGSLSKPSLRGSSSRLCNAHGVSMSSRQQSGCHQLGVCALGASRCRAWARCALWSQVPYPPL